MNNTVEQRLVLVRLHCVPHGRDHWVVIQHVPVPPPSPDVLFHVLERFVCSGQPLAAELVATFPPPRAVAWSDLLPTSEPEPSEAPAAGLPAVAAPEPTPRRGGHLVDEARKLGLVPLASASSARPDRASDAAPDDWDTPRARLGLPDDVRLWRTLRRPDGQTLVVFLFQPFPSRRHVVTDVVIGLRFPYDAGLVEDLKTTLRQWRDAVRGANPRAQTAGGWLPEHHCWFVERPAWPAVAVLLRRHGYPAPVTV